MQYDIYCDEVFPDLLTSERPQAQYLMVGGLWLPFDLREDAKARIADLRERHDTWAEIKWSKVSPSRIDFYLALVDLFISYEDRMQFRCIAVDRNHLDGQLHDGDHELGIYKFHCQMLRPGIQASNSYWIFCDINTNRTRHQLKALKHALSGTNPSAEILGVQVIHSEQVALIQLTDLLLGAASSRMNNTLKEGSAKSEFAHKLESVLGRSLAPEPMGLGGFMEQRFAHYHGADKFRVDLPAGW